MQPFLLILCIWAALLAVEPLQPETPGNALLAETQEASQQKPQPGVESTPELQRFCYQEMHMGVSWVITLYAVDEETALAASKAAFKRIAQLDSIMSDYQPESELNLLSQAAPTSQAVAVSDELWQVLHYSHALAQQSEGAFDVTVGPFVRLWRRARRTGEFPDVKRLSEAQHSVGYQAMELDSKSQAVKLTRPNMQLDLGGVARGYAADEAMNCIQAHGVQCCMIDASGDILVSDAPPGASGWKVGVGAIGDGSPLGVVHLKNIAITTSGDAFQFVEIKGRRYSHIVDPRTGVGLTDHSTVCIIAPTGIAADALATAVSVLGVEAGLQLIEQTEGAAALIIRAKPQGSVEEGNSAEQGYEVFKSERFKQLELL